MPSLSSLRLREYPDPELLAIIDDVADDEGWAHADLIIAELGLETTHARNCVGTRLGWMRRWQMVDHHPIKPSTWRLTRIGQGLILGDLERSVEAMLRILEPQERVMAARVLSTEGASANLPLKTMLRREWKRNIERV